MTTTTIKTKRTVDYITFTADEIARITAAAEAAATMATPPKQFTIKQFKNIYGVTISTRMTGKMKDLYGISTSVLYNPYCLQRVHCDGMICKECYAKAAVEKRPTVRTAYANNAAVLSNVIIPAEHMPHIDSPSGYFRFEAHGDLINEIQVVNYFRMAAANPHLKCALWTKNPWIIKAAIAAYEIEKPSNLVIIGSSYFVDKAMKMNAFEFIDKVFTVYSLAHVDETGIEINCGSRDCAKCGRCYENIGGRDVSEMLKADQRRLAARIRKAAKAAAKNA